MPRKRTSDDVDFVPPDLKPPKRLKTLLLKPSKWEFHPMQIKKPYQHGKAALPPDVCSPYEIFSSFFTEAILEQICEDTNAYATLRRSEDTPKPHTRPWEKTTVKELRAYIAACLWMGRHHESEVVDYWKQSKNTPYHQNLVSHISLIRFQ